MLNRKTNGYLSKGLRAQNLSGQRVSSVSNSPPGAVCVTEQVWVTLRQQGHLDRWKDPSKQAPKPLQDSWRLQEV